MNNVQHQCFTRSAYALVAALCMLFGIVSSSAMATNSAEQSDGNVELLMIDSDDCPYCRKFDREIASIYSKTVEAEIAPLKRHHLGDKLPDKYSAVDINRYTVTPTFILLKDNIEVDRLVGYNGDEFFWFLLNDLLNKLPNE